MPTYSLCTDTRSSLGLFPRICLVNSHLLWPALSKKKTKAALDMASLASHILYLSLTRSSLYLFLWIGCHVQDPLPDFQLWHVKGYRQTLV